MAKATHIGYRDARSGQFVTAKEGTRNPNSTIVERVPNPGRGDTRDAKTGKFLTQQPVTKRGTISNADAVRAVEEYWSRKK